MTGHTVSLSTIINVYAANGKDNNRKLKIKYPSSLFKVQIQINVTMQLNCQEVTHAPLGNCTDVPYLTYCSYNTHNSVLILILHAY